MLVYWLRNKYDGFLFSADRWHIHSVDSISTVTLALLHRFSSRKHGLPDGRRFSDIGVSRLCCLRKMSYRKNVPPQGPETPQLQVPDYSLCSSAWFDGFVFFLLSLYLCLAVGGGRGSIFRSRRLRGSNLILTCCRKR